MDVHHGFSGLERHIGELVTTRRPSGRNDRLRAGQGDLGVLAVGIGHPQRVLPATLCHIGNAGREHAAFPGELFVDEIGNAVRDEPQIARRYRVDLAAEILAAHHVPQPKAHLVAAIGQACHTAAGQ